MYTCPSERMGSSQITYVHEIFKSTKCESKERSYGVIVFLKQIYNIWADNCFIK